MKPITTFEFGNSFNVSCRTELEQYLSMVWNRHFQLYQEDDNFQNQVEDRNQRQGILRFDGNMAMPKNFIGFIQTEFESIEIYPKVFSIAQIEKSTILRHLFYWFDYCRKWKFPFTNVNLGNLKDFDLPELIINIIANQLLEVISTNPISLYQDKEEGMLTPKGSLNFNRYITNSMAIGNFHILQCDHQPMEYDNKLNRTIKYVARLLIEKTKFNETQQTLDKIVFLLDDVEDQVCNSTFLENIPISPFYQDYLITIDLCRMVLDQHIYNHNFEDSKHWSLLLPMEYVFEDFIAGFLQRHFSNEWDIRPQKSDAYLTDEKVFQMQHDIYLTSKKKESIKIIIDTKYKLRGDFKKDKKKGVAQGDLYQMTSYAFRRGCDKVLLLYPNQSDFINLPDIFHISNPDSSQSITVITAEIPFWSNTGHQNIDNLLFTHLNNILSNFT